MKKFIPFYYILVMLAMFEVIPLSLILVIVFAIGLTDLTFSICMFLGMMIVFLGPYAFVKNQENASVVVTQDKVINYMSDGTENYGWAEDIDKLQKIYVADNQEAKKYYKNCKAKKVLILEFDLYHVKYISVNLFTNRQIRQILNYIQSKNSNLCA